jgi:hypothetical protein
MKARRVRVCPPTWGETCHAPSFVSRWSPPPQPDSCWVWCTDPRPRDPEAARLSLQQRAHVISWCCRLDNRGRLFISSHCPLDDLPTSGLSFRRWFRRRSRSVTLSRGENEVRASRAQRASFPPTAAKRRRLAAAMAVNLKIERLGRGTTYALRPFTARPGCECVAWQERT